MMNFSPVAELLPDDPRYPARLRRLACPPASLWLRGQLPEGDAGAGARAVAIVGARAASGTGCDRARSLARALGQAGIAVISGGAYGIDAAAHEGALAAGAPTVAVFGCGIDVVYPDRHGALFDQIARQGALLSEYPPGTQPRPGQFPKRNRLIAALADVVVVVEAAARSGALGTARLARDINVPVLAFSGSPGTERLISGGAVPMAQADDLFDFLAGRAPRRTWSIDRDVTGEPMRHLLKMVAEAPTGAEGLARRLGWPLSKVLGVLGEAEIEGWICRVPGGAYEVTRGH